MTDVAGTYHMKYSTLKCQQIFVYTKYLDVRLSFLPTNTLSVFEVLCKTLKFTVIMWNLNTSDELVTKFLTCYGFEEIVVDR